MHGVTRYSIGRRWIVVALGLGAVILVFRSQWSTGGGAHRVGRDALLFLVVPGLIALAAGKHIGLRVDRRAVRNTLLLSAFVLPFYLVGSTLPTVREYYPMWDVAPQLGSFVPHAVQLFILALATETYFRGLLCVGVRDLGFKCIFISPVVYALTHVHTPPIEFVLSGPTDVLFGAVDYECDSILPSTVAHGCGLVFLDWLVIHEPVLPPELVVSMLDWVPVPL